MDMSNHKRITLGREVKKIYKIKRTIGRGGFGCVYKAIEVAEDGRNLGDYVAIKKIKKEKFSVCANEINIHCKLDHPNIVKLHDFVEETDAIYLIMELCEGGTLHEYVKNNHLKDSVACCIFKQIVEGVKYLHSKEIMHRDLSLQNVLLTKDKQVKIADFGLATHSDKNAKPHHTVCGTPKFMAPEIKGQKGHNDKVDVWSLGRILYGILNKGEIPELRNVDYPRDRFCPEAKELLQMMLEENPAKRICIEEVEKFQFFKKCERNSKLKKSSCRSGDSGNGSQNHLSSPVEKESHFRSRDSGFNSKNSSSKKSKSNSKNEKLRERENFNLQRDQLLPPRRYLWNGDGIHDRKRSASEDRKPLSCNNPQQVYNSRERSASAERARIENLKLYRYYADDACRIISSDGYKRPERYQNNDCGINSAWKAHQRYNPELTENCDDPSCKFSNPLLEGQCNFSPSTCSHSKCSHVATGCCYSQSNHKRHLSSNNIPEKLSEHSLEQKTSPLNAARLNPKRRISKHLNNMVLHISKDSQVIMEILKTLKSKIYVSEVFVISTNGMEIKMYKPPKNTLLDDEHPPPFPKDFKEIKSYDYQKLPKMYHRRYLVAKELVDFLRSKTPKLIYNGKNAKFYVMENGPDPDMLMEFYGGGSVEKKGQRIYITNKFGRECVVVGVTKNLEQDFKSMLEEFLSVKDYCEALLKSNESHNDPDLFPVVFGKRR